MIDFIITILGMCLTVIPFILICSYFLTRISKKTKFDCHIKRVKDKNGMVGIWVAYITKILFLFSILFLGILCVCKFDNDTIMRLFFITVVTYFICNFFDKRNEN